MDASRIETSDPHGKRVPSSRVPMAAPGRETREVHDAIGAAVARVLASGRYVLGAEVEAFEAEVAEALGVPHAIGVASGTDALALALEASGVGAGDEVITTPFTFVATAGAILSLGARPVFVDIEPDTFNLDPSAVHAAVTTRTAAIVPVHLFGLMADMEALASVAGRHGLAVIEDAAQAFGCTQDRAGRPVSAGGWGTAAAFSFYPTKSLGGVGDGGLVTTRDPAVAARVRRLRNHGRGPGGREGVGRNSRLDEIQAAILRAKLPRVEDWTRLRAGFAAEWDEVLRGTAIARPARPAGRRHIFHRYTIQVEDRDGLRRSLDASGVDTAVFYDPPLHLASPFADPTAPPAPGRFPVAETVAARVLSVPVFAHLTCEERDRVRSALASQVA